MGCEHGIDPRRTGTEVLDFTAIFDNINPVALEIGSGKGRFLVASAREHPELNFVGIEKSLHYYRVILARLEKAALSNVRIINFDAHQVLEKMIPDASVSEVHIYFPDPWPRPRERKRRIIREETLDQFRRILRRDGIGFFVTDHREYFDKSVPLFERMFEVTAGEVRSGAPRTKYEAKYRDEGRAIHQIMFRQR